MIKIKKINYNFILWGIFLISILVKSLFILPVKGPSILNDEVYYKAMGEILHSGRFYNSTQYPLGYPFFISFSFFFENHFYVVIQLLNVLVTSSLVFIVWNLCRLFFNEKNSLICTLISILMPFHYIYPKYIMSENLYFPLFMMSVVYLFKSAKTKKNKDIIIFGCLLGGLQLIRHITISIFPFLLIMWCLEFYYREDKLRVRLDIQLLKKIWIVFVFYGIVYSPWLISCSINGFTLKQTLGFSIGNLSKPSKNIATSMEFVKWIILYFSYIILMVSPFITNLVAVIETLLKKKYNKDEFKFIILTILITGGLSFAAIRHSWRAGYNYPVPSYIIGRYIMYISMLWLINSFIINEKLDLSRKNKKKYIIYHIIGLLLFFIGNLVLIQGDIIQISEYFLIPFNSLDSIIFKNVYFTIFIIIFTVISILILVFKKKYYKKISFIGIIVFYISSMIYISNLKDESGYHGAVLNEVYHDEFNENENIILYDDINLSYLEGTLFFWGIDLTKVTIKPTMNADDWNQNGLLMTRKKLTNSYLKTYDVGGQTYYFYRLPLESGNKDKIVLTNTYPDLIMIGTDFNVQPDGTSAMTITGENIPQEVVLYINDNPYKEVVMNDNGSISTLIPAEYYQHIGELSLQVKLEIDGYVINESNKIVIPIEE